MTTTTKTLTLALAGNPNCGKTTIFNRLTGSTAKIGNWPGVTVERREGRLTAGGFDTLVVDLPGIYSLAAESVDERIARDYLFSGAVDLVVNIVDASNLERSLYLTANLLECGTPVIVALNMMDAAEKAGLAVDADELERRLGCPVLPLTAVRNDSFTAFKRNLIIRLDGAKPGEGSAAPGRKAGGPPIRYHGDVEAHLGRWAEALDRRGREIGISGRYLAIGLLEGESFFRKQAGDAVPEDMVREAVAATEFKTGNTVDMVMADSRYRWITEVCSTALRRIEGTTPKADRVDAVLMHRWFGIPIFFAVMYLVFWVTMNVGGSFIDFFDMLVGGVVVDGLGLLLSIIGSPEWLISIIAGGVGGGVQVVATFIPIIFVLFAMLAILEDSGYMARAAFVMDRAMSTIGLPGKAFVPMLVGFGCTVPAIMATRTLESERDRFMTIFMTPFMSCGARLPVYALFTAAFFGLSSGTVVFSIYLVGIGLAVVTGLLLKLTLFRSARSPFVMELPRYHVPRPRQIFVSAWRRLKAYLFRAGVVIVAVVLVLSVLNSWGTDGSWGNEDTDNSVLAAIGKTITPVFTPMGVSEENWPATVGLFTGIFAKEAVVGTLNALYDAGDRGEEGGAWDPIQVIGRAAATVGENLAGVFAGLADPLGLGIVTGEEAATAEELGTGAVVFGRLRDYFTPLSAYAYLLFVLVYFPCVAALGAAVQETGRFYGTILVTYLTLLAWITSTLFYQIAEGRQVLWIAVALALLGAIVAGFFVMSRGRGRIDYAS